MWKYITGPEIMRDSVDLSENRCAVISGERNRMKDSIELFDQICNNEWFSSTAMILFLNKIDLFAEKITRVNITCALKHYKGNFFLVHIRFLDLNKLIISFTQGNHAGSVR
ncbi:hypothetical protein COOONC_26297 [Cooperia oncophora]